MKKFLLSLLTISAVAAVVITASSAFFSDTETSNDNTFEAGAIDLQIDYQGYYNKKVDGQPNAGNWSLKDLVDEKFFNFTDIKPGDFGEGTLSVHVYNNDAWMCMYVENMESLENGINDPEIEAGDELTESGELADNLYFTAWADDGDNIWESGETLLFSNQYGPASDVLNGKTYAIADSTTGYGPIIASTTQYIGLKWCAGEMKIIPETGVIACDGSTMGNESQTDSVTADLRFYVEQYRNNPDFRCVRPTLETLILENKDQNYNRLTNDGIYAELLFNPSASTFDYDLKAYGLAASSTYKLIYYADPWAGNHPGALIGTFGTDASGKINVTGQSYDFGYDLPNASDANSPDGAKIWLIPGAAYTDGSYSVNTWPFANDWLFETNLITYEDTDA